MLLQTDWYLYLGGIGLSLLSTIMFNYAPVLQKAALSKMAEIKANNLWKSFKAMITSKKWLLGHFYDDPRIVTMIVTILGGIVIFHQAAENWVSYSIGIGLAVAGIVMLSKFQVAVNPPVPPDAIDK
ncbi:MAG: hypothetical protein Q6373_018985 [Candidatus Sigynarchaeota archaeon]